MAYRVPRSWEDADAAKIFPPNSDAALEVEAMAVANGNILIEGMLASQEAVSTEIAALNVYSDYIHTTNHMFPPREVHSHAPPASSAPHTLALRQAEHPFCLLIDVHTFSCALQAFGDDSGLQQLQAASKLSEGVACGLTTMRRIQSALSGGAPGGVRLTASKLETADACTDIASLLFSDDYAESDEPSRVTASAAGEELQALLLIYRVGHRKGTEPVLVGTSRITASEHWRPAADAFCSATEALMSSGTAFHCSVGGVTYDAQALSRAVHKSIEAPYLLQLVVCYPSAFVESDGRHAILPMCDVLDELTKPWTPVNPEGPFASIRTGVVDALRSLVEGAHRDVMWKISLWRLVQNIADACDSDSLIPTSTGTPPWWAVSTAELAASPLVRLLVPLIDRSIPQPALASSCGAGDSEEDDQENRELQEKVASVAAALHAAGVASTAAVLTLPVESVRPAPWVTAAAWEAMTLIDAWASAFGGLPRALLDHSNARRARGGASLPAGLAPHVGSGSSAVESSEGPTKLTPTASRWDSGVDDDECGPSLTQMRKGIFAVRGPQF